MRTETNLGTKRWLAGFLLVGWYGAICWGGIYPLAFSEQWALLKSGEQVASLYLDKESIVEKEGLHYFWLKSVMTYANKRRKQDQKREIRLYHALNCQTKEVYPPIQMRMYQGDGKLVNEVKQEFNQVKTGRRNISDLAAGDKVYSGVCGMEIQRTAVPEDIPSKP